MIIRVVKKKLRVGEWVGMAVMQCTMNLETVEMKLNDEWARINNKHHAHRHRRRSYKRQERHTVESNVLGN